jgi:hypothetical protein
MRQRKWITILWGNYRRWSRWVQSYRQRSKFLYGGSLWVVVRRVLPRDQPRHELQGWRNGNGITISWCFQAASTGRCLSSSVVVLSCVDFRAPGYGLCPLSCSSREVEDRHPEERPTTNWRCLRVGMELGLLPSAAFSNSPASRSISGLTLTVGEKGWADFGT